MPKIDPRLLDCSTYADVTENFNRVMAAVDAVLKQGGSLLGEGMAFDWLYEYEGVENGHPSFPWLRVKYMRLADVERIDITFTPEEGDAVTFQQVATEEGEASYKAGPGTVMVETGADGWTPELPAGTYSVAIKATAGEKAQTITGGPVSVPPGK